MSALVPSETRATPIVVRDVSPKLSGEIERFVLYQEHDRTPRCVYDENESKLTITFERPFPAEEPTLKLLLNDINNLKLLHDK